MNEAQISDLIVDWLVANTRHIVSSRAWGNWEMIDFDDTYLEILAFDFSYDEENAIYDFERQFNRDFAGEWQMEISPNRNHTQHTIVCQRQY